MCVCVCVACVNLLTLFNFSSIDLESNISTSMMKASNMASREVEPSLLERMCLLSIKREEFNKLKKFKAGRNVKHHFINLEEKFDDLSISEEEKPTYLLESLNDDVKHELFALPQYKANKKNYTWLKNKLMIIFKEKETKIGTMVNLLNLKQKPNQSVREFISEIRIESWKVMGDEDAETRESNAVLSFINGIRNRTISTALRQLSPKTLEEAYALVKREAKKDMQDTQEDVETIRIMANSNQNMETMMKNMAQEILELKQLVSKLNLTVLNIQKTNNRPQRPGFVAFQQNPRNFSTEPNKNFRPQQTKFTPSAPQMYASNLACFNCNGQDHLVRNCPYPAICRHCRESGHLQHMCPKKKGNFNQEKRFRKVQDEEFSEPTTNEILDDSVSQHLNENCDMPACAVMHNEWQNVTKIKKRKRYNPRGKIVPDDIEQWSLYVNGKNHNPPSIKTENKPAVRQNCKTVISKSNPEYARNKPVVACKVEGNNKNVFFDSGCESNIIDYEYAKRLGCKVLFRPRGQLKCANGSPLMIIGYTVVNVIVGKSSFRCKCTIVEKIFPNLIIGIRTQKEENIDISAGRDCIIIKGERVDFLSKVTVSEN